VTQWAYDVEGRPTTKTYADNSTITYSGAVSPTPNVAFAYDPYFPRLTSMTDGTGLTSYAYQPVGTPGALQLAQETAPLTGAAIAYAYDALGRLSSRTVSGAGAETFGYDAIGRLTSHGSDLGAFALAYLGQTSQVVSRALANTSLATSWSYLPNSGDRRLSGVTTTGLSAGQSTSFTFTTNDESQITGSTQNSDAPTSYPPGSLSQTAGYNTLNQLTTLSGQS
jgi:YD repeat-containing protein